MSHKLENKWDDKLADSMSEPELLLYRSNLLGSDLRITNYGGGNTSAKIEQADPLTGENTTVLWVKGSGGDLGTMGLDGFSTLYLDKLRKLKSLYRGLEHEDEMVGYLPHCTFNLNPRAASIDTPLHSYVPHKHVDHMHPDAVIAIACTKNSRDLTRAVFGDTVGWLPWQRPGYDLGLKLEQIARQNPDSMGVILEGHGLFTWAESSKDCYETTIAVLQQAADWLSENNTGEAFGGPRYSEPLGSAQRREVAATLMPHIRGRITAGRSKVGHFNDSPEVLQFVNSKGLKALAALGTSCPDHFLRTKIRPLVIDFDPGAPLDQSIRAAIEGLDRSVAEYRRFYEDYFERCRHDNSPDMRDPNAVVYLVPGVGMITFAEDKPTARIAAEFYVNAINVMREADGVSEYVGLDEQEAFDIEYWLLEEAKLRRRPKPGSLAGKIAFVTGGAGGIGKATARRFLEQGACVVVSDIDQGALGGVVSELTDEFDSDVVRGVVGDVAAEESVRAAFLQSAAEYGGIDIVVSNAGIASSASLDDTSLAMWDQNMSILVTGYFLVAREAFKLLRLQNVGGSIVIVGSKNGLVASPNASAYCTAKAAELQLSRAIALEGAPLGVRCNVVNPDAVLRGSRIWSGAWREERAAAYELSASELEEHYRQRSLLKRNVYPEDVAEAIYFLASDASSKSTGNIINVDAGHAPSFTR